MSSFYPKVQPAVQESNSRVNTEFNTVTAIEVGLYNERFKSVLTNTPSTDSIDVNVVGGGGGGSTQYSIGDVAPTVGNLQLGVDDTSGNATVLMTTDPVASGINRLQVTDEPVNSTLSNMDFTLANLDGKITSGADTTLATAQQVLTYGEVTAGPGAGELHPLHISQAGDLQVEISGLESTGQEAMAASLPVVIASNQSAVATTNASITSGSDFLLASTQQVGLYGYNGTNWERASHNVVTDGLQVSTLKVNPEVTTQTIATLAGGTALSNAIDLRGFSRCSLYGNSTKLNMLEVLVSDDDVTYYADPTIMILQDVGGDFAHSLDANIAVRYIKVRQTDNPPMSNFTLVIKSSRR